jgi:hypothetical protein
MQTLMFWVLSSASFANSNTIASYGFYDRAMADLMVWGLRMASFIIYLEFLKLLPTISGKKFVSLFVYICKIIVPSFFWSSFNCVLHSCVPCIMPCERGKAHRGT